MAFGSRELFPETTLAYYQEKPGFECREHGRIRRSKPSWRATRQAIPFRCAEPPTANPNKYPDELLDAYRFVEDADALYAELVTRGVEFTRSVDNTPWHCREFAVKDCDGRLVAFGANL